MAYYKLLIHNYLLFVKLRYRGERLWLNVLSGNGEDVVGCVWNHLVNLGLLFGHMIQFPICDILDGLFKD